MTCEPGEIIPGFVWARHARYTDKPEKILGVHRKTINRKVKAKLFPEPKIMGGRPYWLEATVELHMNSRAFDCKNEAAMIASIVNAAEAAKANEG